MKPGQARRVETNLTIQQEVFDRSYTSLLSSLKYTDKRFLSDLNVIQSETDKQREEESQNLQKSLLAIATVIQKLKCNIRDEQYVEEHDIDYFKNHLTSIEENISSFESLLEEKTEALAQEEEELQQAVDVISRRINETSRSKSLQSDTPVGATTRLYARPRVDTKPYENLHPDIQEYQKFLRDKGGHTGGWDTNDHLLFVRLLQKFRGSEQLTAALLDQMPDKSSEEISEHESWYEEYLTLKEAHRTALGEWRKEHVLQKQNKTETDIDDNMSTAEAIAQVNKTIVHRDPDIKEKIQEWKQKQEEKRKIMMQEMHDTKKKEEEKWRKRAAYFEKQRQLLAERRQEQNAALAQERKVHLVGPLSKEISRLQEVQLQVQHTRLSLKDLWEQDRQFMQRKQSLLQNKREQSSRSSHSRSSSHSTVQAERDPARLLQMTAAWRARMKRSFSEEGRCPPYNANGPMFIADVPRLGVPKWREGLV